MAKHLVIGYMGSIGKRHFRILKDFGEDVMGLEKIDNYTGTTDLFNKKNLQHMRWADYLWICTPNNEKRKYISWGVKNNKKIFVEKPNIDTDINGNVFTACNYRFHPSVVILKDNLNKIGEILYCRMHYSHYLPYQRNNWKEYVDNNNITEDCGVHFVDLALWLLGKNEGYLKFRYECENEFTDKAQIVLKEINTFIDIDYLRRDKMWGIEVIGKKGTLEVFCQGSNPEYSHVRFISNSILNENERVLLFNKEVYPDEMYKNQLDYLLNNDWKSNINEAMEVAKICS